MLMAASWYHFNRRVTGNFLDCWRDKTARPQRQRTSTPRGRELGLSLSLHLWVPSIPQELPEQSTSSSLSPEYVPPRCPGSGLGWPGGLDPLLQASLTPACPALS